MRDKEGYRDQIERLAEIYPDKVALSVTEAAKVLGIDRRTVVVLIEQRKLAAMDIASKQSKNRRYIIPITAIARMAAG